jgi:hypothetical protein
MSGREAGSDSAADDLSNENRWRVACLLYQLAEPSEHLIGIDRAVDRGGFTVARQIGRDNMMILHKIGNDTQPLGCMLTRAVQQHDAFAIAAFQEGSGDASDFQTSFLDRQVGEQALKRTAL